MKFSDIFPPFRMRIIRRYAGRGPLRILDVGCASSSPQLTRASFPGCTYTAIDIAEPNAETRAVIDSFHQMDISRLDFEVIADGSIDVLILSHVLEHVSNGLDVLSALLPKLRPGGVAYVEYPAIKSLGLPSAYNTLQFCDDPTHVQLYSLVDVGNRMLNGGLRVLDGGTRRDWPRIILAPLSIPSQISSLLKRGKLNAKGLWDISGFAEYAVGVRPRESV